VQCLICHKLDGVGAADVGPDLNLPQNPAEYLAPARAARSDPQSQKRFAPGPLRPCCHFRRTISATGRLGSSSLI
jgi:hypothetical protein